VDWILGIGERLLRYEFASTLYKVKDSSNFWSQVSLFAALTAVIMGLTLYLMFYAMVTAGGMKVRVASRIAWSYLIVGVLAIAVPIAMRPYQQLLVDPLVVYYLMVLSLVFTMQFGLRLFR
jgi:hypothetical protein